MDLTVHRLLSGQQRIWISSACKSGSRHRRISMEMALPRPSQGWRKIQPAEVPDTVAVVIRNCCHSQLLGSHAYTQIPSVADVNQSTPSPTTDLCGFQPASEFFAAVA